MRTSIYLLVAIIVLSSLNLSNSLSTVPGPESITLWVVPGANTNHYISRSTIAPHPIPPLRHSAIPPFPPPGSPTPYPRKDPQTTSAPPGNMAVRPPLLTSTMAAATVLALFGALTLPRGSPATAIPLAPREAMQQHAAPFTPCKGASSPVQQNRAGCDDRQIATADQTACQLACCADAACQTWNWDSNLTAQQRPAACAGTGGCCWLKNCAGTAGRPCGGTPDCVSWSGSVPPQPPPACPAGEVCFHNHGTRPGVTKSFDCAVRKHAWEFAQATLPDRGSFRTAYDALQLQACDVPTPAE